MKLAKFEAAARVGLEFNRAFNRRDADALARLYRDDARLETPTPAPDGTTLAGREAIARHWRDLFAALPGARDEVEELAGFGLRCLLRWRGERPDGRGKPRVVRGVDLFLLKEESIAEHRSYVKGA